MKYRALVLIPSPQGVDGGMLSMSSFEMTMDDNERCLLDVINLNCTSLSSMKDTVDEYFTEVMQRTPTERNVLLATYLGMMQVLLEESPDGEPIYEDILSVLRQEDEYKYLRSDSGYYFIFDAIHWRGVEAAVRDAMAK